MQNINTDEIMKQIRAEIKEKGLDRSMLSFEEIPLTQAHHAEEAFSPASLQQSTDYLCTCSQLEAFPPIKGNFLTVLIKKFLRKLMIFYIVPLVTEQNALNFHTANAVREMHQYTREHDTDALVSRIEELELKQSVHQQEITALQSQIKTLQEQLRSMKA